MRLTKKTERTQKKSDSTHEAASAPHKQWAALGRGTLQCDRELLGAVTCWGELLRGLSAFEPPMLQSTASTALDAGGTVSLVCRLCPH